MVVVHSGERQSTAALPVADVHDVPLLGVLLAQLDHALEQLDRTIRNKRTRKRGAPLRFLLVHLLDRSLGGDRLDALARNLLRVALAEHEQRHVVRSAHSESLEIVGGSAEADEGREVAVLVGSDELAQEVRDSVALVELEGDA